MNPGMMFPPGGGHHHTIMSQLNIQEFNQIFNTTLHGGITPIVLSSSTYIQAFKWIFNSMVTIVFGNDFFAAGLLLMLLNFLMRATGTSLMRLLSIIKSKFIYSLHVTSDDEAFQWLVSWLSKQSYAKKCQNLSVHSSWATGAPDPTQHPHTFKKVILEDDSQTRPNIYYVPAVGSHFFFYKGRFVWFNRNQRESPSMSLQGFSTTRNIGIGTNQTETIDLHMLGFGSNLLQRIIDEACELSYSASEKKTFIYTATQFRTGFERTAVRQIRALDSVILPKDIKEKVIQDVREFRSCREWYAQCGVPYRRGILLYGPPGTGKSSFIVAIAGELRMNVCILTISASTMNDDRLQELMNSAPMNSVLLLEDIDSAFSNKKEDNKDPEEELLLSRFRGRTTSNGVTFAGLLNAIDGVASQEGRILFMTTNHIEQLDPALIRPGRIDLRVEFQLATKEQIKYMFLKFFPGKTKLAEQVAAKIPNFTVSTAQLQGFFLLHKNSVDSVLSDVGRFLKDCKNQGGSTLTTADGHSDSERTDK